MEIVTTQIGQNFAGDIATREKLPETESATKGIEPESTEITAEDIQATDDSADNLYREDQNEKLNIAVEEIESFLQVQNRNLAFAVDENTNRSVVTVKDSESGDVIRQIPSEEVLKLAERIKELQQDIGSSVGVLLNRQV